MKKDKGRTWVYPRRGRIDPLRKVVGLNSPSSLGNRVRLLATTCSVERSQWSRVDARTRRCLLVLDIGTRTRTRGRPSSSTLPKTLTRTHTSAQPTLVLEWLLRISASFLPGIPTRQLENVDPLPRLAQVTASTPRACQTGQCANMSVSVSLTWVNLSEHARKRLVLVLVVRQKRGPRFVLLFLEVFLGGGVADGFVSYPNGHRRATKSINMGLRTR